MGECYDDWQVIQFHKSYFNGLFLQRISLKIHNAITTFLICLFFPRVFSQVPTSQVCPSRSLWCLRRPTRVSNASGFFLRGITGPVISSQFRILFRVRREQLRAIPNNSAQRNSAGNPRPYITFGKLPRGKLSLMKLPLEKCPWENT